MAFKFPFTNYHELNLTWVLDQLKALFEKSEENVTTIETYEDRLTAVETEIPGISETASEASRAAAGAGSLAETAKTTADTAQNNAIQAQGLAGTARQEAQAAQTAANEATQAAQQAQATALNFDGRITQAENDASQALEASRSFENRVQSAITTANNAAQTATNATQNAANALDTAKLADRKAEAAQDAAEVADGKAKAAQDAAEVADGKAKAAQDAAKQNTDNIGNLSDLTTEAKQNLVAAINEAAQTGGGNSSNCAPIIINTVSGAIASFSDGANNRPIEKLDITIDLYQSGTGDPSIDNIRPFSGWTGAEIYNAGFNIWDEEWRNGIYVDGVFYPDPSFFANKNFISVKPSTIYYIGSDTASTWAISFYDKNKEFISRILRKNEGFSTPHNCYYINFNGDTTYYGNTYQNDIRINYPSTDTTYRPYLGKQISVLFPSAAGIVYSGLLTLNPDRTGALVVNGASAVYDGSNDEAWLGEGNGETKYFRIVIGEKNSVIDNEVISNIYKHANITLATNITGINVLNSSAYNIAQIMVRPANVQDLTITDFKALLAETPMQVYWKLTSPQTFQLTDKEISGILSTLYGTNNVWANTGNVEVDYPADTKLYIDGKLAEIQATILENI